MTKEAQIEKIEAAKKNGTTRGKPKRKKILLIAATVGVIALVVFLIIKFVVIPTNQYNQAIAFRAAGNDAEAYSIFDNLGDFKDARDICNTYDYMNALAYLDEGHPKTAFYLLKNMSGYAEAETKAAELLIEYPYFSILSAAPGDEVTIGTYEQDNNISNGPEDIKWIVLKNENGVIYAVSKYVLDAKVYNTHNGDGSTLKGWLKDDFCDIAFSDVSKGFISKVCLLSQDDLDAYRTIVNTKPEWTAYSKAQSAENHYYAGYSWWLDGEYFHGYGSADVDMAVVVESGSHSKYVSHVTEINGVRPAIIIDCVSDDIDYYSDDYADIENAGVTTRTDADVHDITDNNGNSGGKTVCSRCDGTGKVTKHYGNRWNEEKGYQYGEKCGRCGGSGYID